MKSFSEFMTTATAQQKSIDTARAAFELVQCTATATARAAFRECAGSAEYDTLSKLSNGFTTYITRTKKEGEKPLRELQAGKSTFYEYPRVWDTCSLSQLIGAINGIDEYVKASTKKEKGEPTYSELRTRATDVLVKCLTLYPDFVGDANKVLMEVTAKGKNAYVHLIELEGKIKKASPK